MDEQFKQSEIRILEKIISNQRILNLRYAHFASIHVAVLMKRGKIVAEATNGFGSRSRGSGYSASSIHAERNVIKDIEIFTSLEVPRCMLFGFHVIISPREGSNLLDQNPVASARYSWKSVCENMV